jgi:hypothetical protein
MGDRIHPSMHAVEPTADRAMLRPTGTEAESAQLPQRHDTMLLRRQFRHRPLHAG